MLMCVTHSYHMFSEDLECSTYAFMMPLCLHNSFSLYDSDNYFFCVQQEKTHTVLNDIGVNDVM